MEKSYLYNKVLFCFCERSMSFLAPLRFSVRIILWQSSSFLAQICKGGCLKPWDRGTRACGERRRLHFERTLRRPYLLSIKFLEIFILIETTESRTSKWKRKETSKKAREKSVKKAAAIPSFDTYRKFEEYLRLSNEAGRKRTHKQIFDLCWAQLTRLKTSFGFKHKQKCKLEKTKQEPNWVQVSFKSFTKSLKQHFSYY